MDSANVILNLKSSPIGELPTNENQTRYLAQLDSDLQGYVWSNIINTFEAVTGKIVEQYRLFIPTSKSGMQRY